MKRTFQFSAERLVVPCAKPALVFAFLLFTTTLVAQSKPVEAPKAGAMKLPDGTIVLLTKTPEESNPPITGVLLTPAEYQAFVDQADALKKQRDAIKPIVPSSVSMQGKLEKRGERTVAAFTLTFRVRTTQAGTPVLLGCARAAVVSAKLAESKTLPLLSADADGLTMLLETSGEHSIVLELEAMVSPRGTKGELGFEFGLPRTAIGALTLDAAVLNVKKLTLGTRGAEAGAMVKRVGLGADLLTGKPYALGSTDTLEVAWEPSISTTALASAVAETDVAVRVDETQVVSVAKIRLKGLGTEWRLTLPPNAEVTAERAMASTSPFSVSNITVEKPSDPNNPVWLLKTPGETTLTEWLITVTVRQSRMKPTEPQATSAFALGPFHVHDTRQTGKVQIAAPFGIRLGLKPGPALRRQDLPTNADDDLAALYSFTFDDKTKPPPPWLMLEARSAANTPRVSIRHKLRMTPGGWKLESTVRVVPAPRSEVEQLQLEIPTAWKGLEFSPADLIESTADSREALPVRTVLVTFLTPQKVPFVLTLSASVLVPATARDVSLTLPKFVNADERETKLTASVPEGLQLACTAYSWDNGQPGTHGEVLKPAVRGAVASTLNGDFERGLAKLDLNWQTFRPDLDCECRAEVLVQERQFSITQTFRMKLGEGDLRSIRFRGPAELLGLRDQPRIEPTGPEDWDWKLAGDAGREPTLTLQYAVKRPERGRETLAQAIPLFWPENATRLETTLRVWGQGGRRMGNPVGRWRELPPEPSPDRDALPWLTLAASGIEALELQPLPPEAMRPVVPIERAVMQVYLNDDGTMALRGLFRLQQYPEDGVLLRIPDDVVPELLLDGKRIDGMSRADGLLIPGSDFKTRAKVWLLEVRYLTPLRPVEGINRILTPPVIVGATYSTPIRWTMQSPARKAVLSFSRNVPLGTVWQWQGFGVGLVNAESHAGLERWWHEGQPPGGLEFPVKSADADRFALISSDVSPVTVFVMPKLAWVAAISFLAFLVVLLLARLDQFALGLAIVVLAVLLATLLVFTPQMVMSLIPAMQPGLLLAALTLALRAVLLWNHRRFQQRQPTFSRTRPISPTPAPAFAPKPPSRATADGEVRLTASSAAGAE